MPKTPARRPAWPIWLLAILALLLVLYAIAGFLVLPWWLEKQLPQQAQRHLGWQVEAADIDTNPFTLGVTLSELTAADSEGEPVANIQNLHLNLSFFDLFVGQLLIDELAVEQPYLRLRINQDGALNVVEDWQSHSPLAHAPAADGRNDSDRGGGIPLVIDEARVERGNILLQDRRNPDQRDFTISPLDFELTGVTVAAEAGTDAGQYQLRATLGDEQRLTWRGEIVLVPFRSSGVIELENIQAESLWHFVGAFAPYDWRQGRLDFTSDYRVDTGGALQWALENGNLQLRDSLLFLDPDAEQQALGISQLKAEGLRYNWPQSRLEVGDIAISDWTLAISRGESGQFDWVAALQDELITADPDNDQNPEAGASTFSWKVQHLGMTQGSIRWLDQSLEDTAELGLQDIEAELSGLTGDVDQPVSLTLQVSDGQGGQGRLNGDFTVAPFTLEAALQLTDLSLPQLQPYVSEYLRLGLVSGTAGFDGSVSLDDQQPQLTGSLGGNLAIVDFKSRLPDLDEPLLSWESLRLEPLQVSLAPLAIDIRNMDFQGPELTYLRLPEIGNSFSRLIREKTTEPAAAQAETDDSAPIIRVQQLNLENAAVIIEDRVIEGGFSTRIHDIGGSVIGISNRKPQRGEISLQGEVAEQGRLEVAGEIGAFGETDISELELAASNLDATELTPYFARYLGYAVDEGILDLTMEYALEGDQLDGTNEIILRDFSLGERVDSDAAIDAPVKTGIALLRGPGGTIEIQFPIDGELSDPQFSFSDVMVKAFANLVAKAATAPFAVIAKLADLAGFTGEQLGQIGFLPGTANLAPTEPGKLQALADALKDRSGIILQYRGATAPEWDIPALALAAEGYTLPAEDLGSQIRSLERRLVETQNQAALERLIEQYPGRAEGRSSDPDWAQALLQALAKGREPESGVLRELAERRATVLRAALAERGVSPENLAAADTRNNAPFEKGRVMIPLDIDSR